MMTTNRTTYHDYLMLSDALRAVFAGCGRAVCINACLKSPNLRTRSNGFES